MPRDIGFLGLAIFRREIAPQAFCVRDSLLDRPSARGVAGLSERITLFRENREYRGKRPFLIRDRDGAVAMAIDDQAAVPVCGNVDPELGPVDLSDFCFRLGGIGGKAK